MQQHALAVHSRSFVCVCGYIHTQRAYILLQKSTQTHTSTCTYVRLSSHTRSSTICTLSLTHTLTCQILLMYTALLTPVMVGFYWNLPPCWRSPTLEFDVFLDSFFIFEILYTFFVGIESKGVSLCWGVCMPVCDACVSIGACACIAEVCVRVKGDLYT